MSWLAAVQGDSFVIGMSRCARFEPASREESDPATQKIGQDVLDVERFVLRPAKGEMARSSMVSEVRRFASD